MSKQARIAALKAEDARAEQLAADAYLYRFSARQACVLAGLLMHADRKRARWCVRDCARLLGKASHIDGCGVEPSAEGN